MLCLFLASALYNLNGPGDKNWSQASKMVEEHLPHVTGYKIICH